VARADQPGNKNFVRHARRKRLPEGEFAFRSPVSLATLRDTMPIVAPLPDLVLYARAGCSQCDEARDAIRLVLAERATIGLRVPEVVEHDIERDPELHRRYLERIPVVELGAQRVELVVTVGKLRRLLRETLDSTPHVAVAEAGGAATR
jgi:hypothetical protein